MRGFWLGKVLEGCLEEVIFLEDKVCTWREEGKQLWGSRGSSRSTDCKVNTSRVGITEDADLGDPGAFSWRWMDVGVSGFGERHWCFVHCSLPPPAIWTCDLGCHMLIGDLWS